MSDLDEIKKRKLQEMMEAKANAAQQQASQEAQIQQQIELMEAEVKKHLTRDALLRYGNLKSAHQEKAMQVLMVLFQAIQAGQVSEVDDATLKKILQQITPEKKDIKIKRV